MVKALMIGDSGMWGAINDTRHTDHPQVVLNREQNVFDFAYNYSKPGASYAGILSSDPTVRAANGLPAGVSLDELLATHIDCEGVLIGICAANDAGGTLENHVALADRINTVANICINHNKLFAFVGGFDVNTSDSYENVPTGADFYSSGRLHAAAEIAGNMEILRQVCLQEGYAFVDVKNKVPIHNWMGITADYVHPSQEYSRQVYTYVAKAITGQV
jgi:hypothetical protein